jgi:hypothetical protein
VDVRLLGKWVLSLGLSFVLSNAAWAGASVDRPGSTGHAKLDRFVDSSFDLHDQNEYVFHRIDEIGILSAFIVTDPQGFVAATSSGSLSDAVVVAKASSNQKIVNWEKTIQNKSISDVISSVEGDTRRALVARVADIARTYNVKELAQSTGRIATEANTLLSDANRLLRDAPKNPLKVKRYISALNASKKVLKKMVVEYPEKIALITKFFS